MGGLGRRDTTVVELHRVGVSPIEVREIDGRAYRVSEEGEVEETLAPGALVRVGETVALDAGARVVVGKLTLSGGRRGKAHAFVPDHAFRSAPGRNDVPKLLAQLAEVDRQVAALGEDPLGAHEGPSTPYERAYSAEFARTNLVYDAARTLPESVARQLGAVCLFFSDETAFVALSEVSLSKFRTLMQALGCPVSPHLVEDSIVRELLERVYTSGQGPS